MGRGRVCVGGLVLPYISMYLNGFEKLILPDHNMLRGG